MDIFIHTHTHTNTQHCIVLYFKIKVNKDITPQKLRSSAEGILDFYLSIFSTDDDFVLTRV